MAYDTKIATCCYCGTRAALVLMGARRHELACSGCGAPLHEMKPLKERSAAPRAAALDTAFSHPPRKMKKRKKIKKSKSLSRKAAKGLFELIEDILD